MSITWIQLIAQEASIPTPPAEVAHEGIWDVVLQSQGVVLLVLVVLALASVASWFIIGFKWLSLRRASGQSTAFLDAFWQTRKLDDVDDVARRMPASPLSHVFHAGYEELRRVVGETGTTDAEGLDNVERAMRRSALREMNGLERLLPFLATVGSTAPFVGLFGTVWGIMKAFMEISATGAAGIDVVAGPIAEALIATAIGLVAAIPAVMGYNFFNATLARIQTQVDGFAADFLNIVKRSFMS